MPRIEGQVWIGTQQPHRIKYYAGGTEYWGVSASTYPGSTVYKGMVVAADETDTDTNQRVRPAVWPTDANNIVGVCVSDPEEGNVRVVSYGYIEFANTTELGNAFVTKSDLTVGAPLTGTNYYTAFGNTTTDGGAGNGWDATAGVYDGKGEPIYWFTGRSLLSGAATYSWEDSADHAGLLTFATPSGYKISDTEIPWSDDSFDIGYKSLPTIGNVVSYTRSGTDIATLSIHVNFTKFQSKIRFEYPATGLNQYTSTSTETLTLRHGIFSDLRTPEVDVSMMGYSDSDIDTGTAGETTRVWPGFDTFLGVAADKRTEVEIASNSSFYYKVFGEVSFNF